MAEDRIVLTNWDKERPIIRESDLGWSENMKRDAFSDDNKKVFDYYVRCGFNIRFYNTYDGIFYCLFQESEPIKIGEVERKQSVDSPFLTSQVYDDSHALSRIVKEFNDTSRIWDTPCIGGKALKDILPHAVIVAID